MRRTRGSARALRSCWRTAPAPGRKARSWCASRPGSRRAASMRSRSIFPISSTAVAFPIQARSWKLATAPQSRPCAGTRSSAATSSRSAANRWPDALRAKHLSNIRAPMLFVQGSRDAFGTPDELRPILAKLEAPAALHVVENGDHSFKVPKRAGIAQDEIYEAILDRIEAWL